MDTRSAQIARGWSVVGSDGGKIGEVEETHEDHIVVSRGMLLKHHLYVPIDHVTQAADGKVTVRVAANKVEEEGWRYPPNAGFAHEKPAYPTVPETTTIQAAGYSAGRLSAPEPQGAVLDDGLIDPDEVPNEDVGPDDEDPEGLDSDAKVR
ncbi:MAG: DUF2171 domain-containing protein [Candidatus Limnocylindrales bacterium]